MKDPQFLLDDGATELELRLLQAGAADGPSVKARHAAMAALGLSAAVLSASAPAAAGSPALASGVRLISAKWWAMGALVTVTGAAGLGYVALAGSHATSPTAQATPQRPRAQLVSASPVAEPTAPVASAAPVLPVTPAPERPLSPQLHSSSSAGTPGIQEQIALIDRARAAVVAHQPSTAMVALDEYQRRFPGGVLTQEAALLRIDALLARGDRANAARLGHQFLARYPRSAMAGRVKALIDG